MNTDSGETPHSPDGEINVINDPIAIIRMRPKMYIGDHPTGARFMGSVVEDLLLLDAGPLHVAKDGFWHRVYAERDWLITENGSVSFEPFRRLIPMPSGGRLYDRMEVILVALTDAVVTVGRDGINWISGQPGQLESAGEPDLSLPSPEGRVLAFHFPDALLGIGKTESED
jgi:hypothetical protein